MKALFIVPIAVLLGACAATTPQQAREMGPERRYVFEVATDYQTVYRRILGNERNCEQYSLGTAMQMVNGDLYPDTKTGSITVGMYGAIGASIYQVIDIAAIDDSRTSVTGIFPMGGVEAFGKRVKAWADGSKVDC